MAHDPIRDDQAAQTPLSCAVAYLVDALKVGTDPRPPAMMWQDLSADDTATLTRYLREAGWPPGPPHGP